MFSEISLNILDIVQNSISARASLIEITVNIDTKGDTLTVVIEDNGSKIPSLPINLSVHCREFFLTASYQE